MSRIGKDGVPFGEAGGALLFHEDDVGGCVGEVSSFQRKGVVGVIGKGGPKGRRKIAVFRARDRFATRAVMHFGFEIAGSVAADFAGISAFDGFVMAGVGVGVNKLFEGILFYR